MCLPPSGPHGTDRTQDPNRRLGRMNPRHRPVRQLEALGLEVTIMTPDEFCDAVLLAVANTHGVPQPKFDRWATSSGSSCPPRLLPQPLHCLVDRIAIESLGIEGLVLARAEPLHHLRALGVPRIASLTWRTGTRMI